MNPFAPAEIRLSTAATCDSLSPSFLPAKDCTDAPTDFAELSAPSFIFTKNGLVSVFVIRPILTASPPPPPVLVPEPPPLSSPQATAPTPSANAAATTTARLPLRANECPVMSLSSSNWGDLDHLRERLLAVLNRSGAGLSSWMKTIHHGSV